MPRCSCLIEFGSQKLIPNYPIWRAFRLILANCLLPSLPLLPRPPSFSLFPSLNQSLPPPPPPSLYLSLSVVIDPFLFSHSLSLSISMYLSLSLLDFSLLSLSASPTFSLYTYLSISIHISLTILSHCNPIFIQYSLSLFISLSPSQSLHLFHTLSLSRGSLVCLLYFTFNFLSVSL